MKKILFLIFLFIPSLGYSFNDISSGLMNTPIATSIRTGKVQPDNTTLSVSNKGIVSLIHDYAEIYVADGSTAQSIATGATYVKITPFLNNGLSLGATPDHVNDKITVTRSGKYEVSFYFSSSIATNDVNLYTAVFINGVEVNNIHSLRATKASTISVSASSGFITIAAGQDVDVRCRHNNGTAVDLTVIYGNLHVKYMGE